MKRQAFCHREGHENAIRVPDTRNVVRKSLLYRLLWSDADKQVLTPIARELIGRGYTLVATSGTASYLNEHFIQCESVNKVMEGRPHVVDLIKNNEINFIVNTTEGAQAISDSFSIRREALQRKISYTTTIAGGRATLRALDHENDYTVHSLQQLHRGLDT